MRKMDLLENGNFRSFAANGNGNGKLPAEKGNGKRKFVFLGRQINVERHLLFQQTAHLCVCYTYVPEIPGVD